MIKLIRRNIPLLLLLFVLKGFSQVGIGTTNPQETLHVNGTVRVDNTISNNLNSTRLTGLDTNGTINEVEVGDNLSLSGGVLSATGAVSYGVAIITDNFSNQTVNNYDLDLNGVNSDKTVFILRQSTGSAQSTSITGLSGGTDGRIVILKSDTNNLNINIRNENGASTAINRFKHNGDRNVNGFGSITLVYVGAESRWEIISFYLN